MRGREDALRALADMVPDLTRIREKAVLACAGPEIFEACGVPLSAYLLKINEISILGQWAARELRKDIGL